MGDSIKLPLLMLPRGTHFKNHFPGDSAQILAAAGSIKEATDHSVAAGQHSQENTTRDLPGRGPGHRYRWCPGHTGSRPPPCPAADNRLCSRPPGRTACNGPSSELERKHTTQRDFWAQTPRQPARRPRTPPTPDTLTSTVLGDPAHAGKQTVDVKMFAVKVSALLLSEVPLLLETRLCVTRLELHSTPYTVLATVFRPGERKGKHTRAGSQGISPHITLSSVASCLLGKWLTTEARTVQDKDSAIRVCFLPSCQKVYDLGQVTPPLQTSALHLANWESAIG